MTGNDVKRTRERFGFTPQQFADLLGVSLSGAYRWESLGARSVGIDPLQARVLAFMATQIDAPDFDALAADVRDALVLGGGLLGLYRLLHAVYGAEAKGGKAASKPRKR